MDWLPFVALARSVAIVARAIGLVIVSSVVVEPLISLAVKPFVLINCSFLIYRSIYDEKHSVKLWGVKWWQMISQRKPYFIKCPLIQ